MSTSKPDEYGRGNSPAPDKTILDSSFSSSITPTTTSPSFVLPPTAALPTARLHSRTPRSKDLLNGPSSSTTPDPTSRSALVSTPGYTTVPSSLLSIHAYEPVEMEAFPDFEDRLFYLTPYMDEIATLKAEITNLEAALVATNARRRAWKQKYRALEAAAKAAEVIAKIAANDREIERLRMEAARKPVIRLRLVLKGAQGKEKGKGMGKGKRKAAAR